MERVLANTQLKQRRAKEKRGTKNSFTEREAKRKEEPKKVSDMNGENYGFSKVLQETSAKELKFAGNLIVNFCIIFNVIFYV